MFTVADQRGLFWKEISLNDHAAVRFVEAKRFREHFEGRVQTERDGTRAETRFGLPAKRTSPFISAGVSVQSSTDFLGVRVGG